MAIKKNAITKKQDKYTVMNGHGEYYCGKAWDYTKDEPKYVFKLTPETAVIYGTRKNAQVMVDALKRFYLKQETEREANGLPLAELGYRDSDLTHIEIVTVGIKNGVKVINGLERESATKTNFEERQAVLSKTGGHCAYCGKEITMKTMHMTYLKPLAKGGEKTEKNLMPACVDCYRFKGDMTITEMKKAIEGIVEDKIYKNLTLKVAEDFGQIKRTPSEVQFYYLKQGVKN